MHNAFLLFSETHFLLRNMLKQRQWILSHILQVRTPSVHKDGDARDFSESRFSELEQKPLKGKV